MHPNGQMPAYEFALRRREPAGARLGRWRVYKMTRRAAQRDRAFLARVFQKLLLNFTWWVNRKDAEGKNLFAGGFLGLDNIGVFDRSQPLPTGGHLEQADGTAWMAFYCATMLSMALELAKDDPAYEDVASKFFEHFVAHRRRHELARRHGPVGRGGRLLLRPAARCTDTASRCASARSSGSSRSFAVEVLDDEITRPPARLHEAPGVVSREPAGPRRSTSPTWRRRPQARPRHRLLAIPSRERLVRVLRYLLDEREFLSPYGIRSLSRVHQDHPYVFHADGGEHRVDYVPGESNTRLFGGNSNWRGPIWFPINYLLIEALERYHHFYGDTLHGRVSRRARGS